VRDIKILYTVLDTFDNKRVVIPNGNLANSSVTNFSINPTRPTAPITVGRACCRRPSWSATAS